MSALLPVLIVLVYPPPTMADFFSGHGYFNNSCPVRVCQTCGVGQYRLGCANASGGVCANCTRVPNATLTSHGWFNNSCNFTCNEGFAVGQGRSCNSAIVRYTIEFWTIVVTGNNETFNVTTYVRKVAATAGCGECGIVSNNPAMCGHCKIWYYYKTFGIVVFRRLLSSSNKFEINTTIVIDDNKALAENSARRLTSAALTTELAKSDVKYESLSLVAPVEMTTKVIAVEPPTAPPPAPPPVPPPTPPPSEDSGPNIGAIAGGTVGGVLGLALIAVLVVLFTKKTVQPPPPLGSASIFKYKQVRKLDTPRLASNFVYLRRT